VLYNCAIKACIAEVLFLICFIFIYYVVFYSAVLLLFVDVIMVIMFICMKLYLFVGLW